MIKNLADAFEYVNSRYVFNEINYPVIGRLTDDQKKIFSINHSLLHILKSANKIKDDVPFEKKGVGKMQWMAQPDEKLGSIPLIQKTASLKMIVNILSLANTIGITKEQIIEFKIPIDDEMISYVPVENMGQRIVPTFTDSVQYLIELLATLLEEADHKNVLDEDAAKDVIKRSVLSIMYWFDDFWVPDFLAQIPSVMKSK